ncbi:hypothetical protein C8R45DRAFT_1089260 [Mycena sanguinolenta]|nr:hypothetical protein C8R45DRAFT_1089260 [Mycena sanguinolenta]
MFLVTPLGTPALQFSPSRVFSFGYGGPIRSIDFQSQHHLERLLPFSSWVPVLLAIAFLIVHDDRVDMHTATRREAALDSLCSLRNRFSTASQRRALFLLPADLHLQRHTARDFVHAYRNASKCHRRRWAAGGLSAEPTPPRIASRGCSVCKLGGPFSFASRQAAATLVPRANEMDVLVPRWLFLEATQAGVPLIYHGISYSARM